VLLVGVVGWCGWLVLLVGAVGWCCGFVLLVGMVGWWCCLVVLLVGVGWCWLVFGLVVSGVLYASHMSATSPMAHMPCIPVGTYSSP